MIEEFQRIGQIPQTLDHFGGHAGGEKVIGRTHSASISCMSSSAGFIILSISGMKSLRTLQTQAQRLKAGPDTVRLRPGLTDSTAYAHNGTILA